MSRFIRGSAVSKVIRLAAIFAESSVLYIAIPLTDLTDSTPVGNIFTDMKIQFVDDSTRNTWATKLRNNLGSGAIWTLVDGNSDVWTIALKGGSTKEQAITTSISAVCRIEYEHTVITKNGGSVANYSSITAISDRATFALKNPNGIVTTVGL